MGEDPLPAPAVQYRNAYTKMEQRKLKKSVAVILCLFLGLALVLYPQVAFTQNQNELGILKFNSSVNQAPRAIFFGALAVLPHNIELNIASLPHGGEVNRENAVNLILKSRSWIIMVWYGSTYV